MSEGRTCTWCGEFKLASEFGIKRWTKKDGTVRQSLKSRCNPCKVATEKERINATPESKAHYNKRVSVARKKRLANMTPEQKEKRRELTRKWQTEWRRANPDKVFELKKKHRETHADYIKAKKARDAKTEHGRALDRARGERYRLAHPERVKELHAISRGKRREIDKEDARAKRVELRASYVAQCLGLPIAEVPEELIEAERVRIKLKRLVQKLEETRTEKKCSTCKVYRPLFSFSTSPHTKDGRCYECLICKREKRKKEALSKGLTYKPRRMNEFGRSVKMSPEELRANKNARERMRYALNKQRKANEKHN